MFEQALNRIARQKADFALDVRIALPDGTIKYIHSIGHPIVGENGELVEFIGTAMDVTALKRAEEERQRSFEQLRALAARQQSVREEERTRVAREIHDQLGQALTAIKIEFASFIHDLPTQYRRSSKTESILQLVSNTIESVRRISTELRPGILDDLGLVAAVEWAAEEFEARTGITVNLDLPQDDIVTDQERATALFRIFQETLTNVARHARASDVSVRLAEQNGNLILQVRDDGVGMSEQQLSGNRIFGIVGMRERAALLGGELKLSTVPGEGVAVEVHIPGANFRHPEQDS